MTRRPPKRPTRPARSHAPRVDDHPVVQEVRPLLRHKDPWAVHTLASALVEQGFGLAPFVAGCAQVDVRETTALLSVLGGLLQDHPDAALADLAVECRRTVMTRTQPLPPEVRDPHDQRPDPAWRLHGDQASLEHLVVGVRTGGGHAMTWIVMIDHAHGGVVSDAFYVVDETADDVAAHMERLDSEIALRRVPLELDDARALLERGIAAWHPQLPLPQRESWPDARSMLRTTICVLPDGGQVSGPLGEPAWEDVTGWEPGLVGAYPDEAFFDESFFDEDAAQQVLDTLGPRLDVPSQNALVVLLAMCDTLGLHPMAWTADIVEDVLLACTELVLDDLVLARLVDVLGEIVRYCCLATTDHEPVEDLLAAVESLRQRFVDAAWEPDLVRRREAALAVIDGSVLADVERMTVLDSIGGEEIGLTLDVDALPDEPFDPDGVPDEVRDLCLDVDSLLARAVPPLAGREVLTACRHLLTDIACQAPRVLRRGKPLGTAAAIAYAVCEGNGLLWPAGDLRVGDLTKAFGTTSSPRDRATSLLHAAQTPGQWSTSARFLLRDANLLVSARRRELRDLATEVLAAQQAVADAIGPR